MSAPERMLYIVSDRDMVYYDQGTWERGNPATGERLTHATGSEGGIGPATQAQPGFIRPRCHRN